MSVWEEGSEKPDGFFYRASQANSKDSHAKGEELFNGTMNTLWLSYTNSSNTSTRTIVSPLSTEDLMPGNYTLSYYLKGSGWLRGMNLMHEDIGDNLYHTADTKNASDKLMIFFPCGQGNTSPVLYEDWTKIEENVNITAEGKYRVSYSHNNFVNDPDKPFLLANIVLELKEAISGPSLTTITLEETNYTSESPGGVEILPQFDPEVYSYTVELSNNYEGGVPVVGANSALASNEVVVTQAVNLDGTEAERTATIVVTAEDESSLTFTVTFEQSEDFINGFHYDFKALANIGGWGYNNSKGSYARDLNPEGIYWGSASLRGVAGGNIDFNTPPLKNGAGTMTYYVKDANQNESMTSDLLIQYREDEEADWELLESVPSSVLTNKWVKRTVEIDKTSQSGQVRFYIAPVDEGNHPRNFALDDIRISANNIGSGLPNVENSDLDVKIVDHTVLVKVESPQGLLQLYGIDGRLIKSVEIRQEFTLLNVEHTGIYVLKYGDSTKKILIQ